MGSIWDGYSQAMAKTGATGDKPAQVSQPHQTVYHWLRLLERRPALAAVPQHGWPRPAHDVQHVCAHVCNWVQEWDRELGCCLPARTWAKDWGSLKRNAGSCWTHPLQQRTGLRQECFGCCVGTTCADTSVRVRRK